MRRGVARRRGVGRCDPGAEVGFEVELGPGVVADGRRGVGGPDLGRVAAAVDAAAASGALERDLLAALGLLAEHADRGDQLRRVADEPRRLVVVGGTGLAGRLVVGAVHRLLGRTVVDHTAQYGGDGVGGPAGQHLGADRVRQLDLLRAVLRLGDHGRFDLLAVVVERGVGGGHLERAGAHAAERHRGLDVHPAAVHAEADRGLLDRVQAHVGAHLREDGVDGVVGGLLDADPAVVDLVLVRRGERLGAVDHRAAVAAVVDRVGGDGHPGLGLGVVLQGGGEDQRLERGGGLEVGPGGVVRVVLGVARAAVHRHDVAGRGVDRDGTELGVPVRLALGRVEVVGQLRLDGLLQVLLLLLVDSQGDGPAAGHQLLLVDALTDQLVVGGVDEVPDLTGHTGQRLGLDGLLERLLLPVGLVEPLHLDHVVQRVRPALLHPLLAGVGGDGPVVLAGGLEQGGQVGALTDGQLVDVHAVVRLGRRLDAVRAAAVVAGVHVPGEDLVLAELVVHLEGDDDLLELAADRLLLAQVVVLDVLLGDGRAALLALALEGVEDAAQGALQVDAGVLVEGLVLGRDEGVLDVLGDLVDLDGLAVHRLVRALAGHDRAVGVLVDVALAGGLEVPLVGDVHVQVQPEEAEDAQQAHAEEGPEELLPGEEAAYTAFPVLRLRPALTPLSRSPRVRSPHRSRNSSRSAPNNSAHEANTASVSKCSSIKAFPDVTKSTRAGGTVP